MERLIIATLVWLVAAAGAAAQVPTVPPPPAGEGDDSGAPVHELLPGIGRIGAQVGLTGGASWHPFKGGTGVAFGGFIDLPLGRARGGRLSYEILLVLSDAQSDPFRITDSVALVANLAAGADLPSALAGPPRAPFPVTRLVRTRTKLLQVSPFGLRYTLTGLDRHRLRPYLAGGLDFVVVITRDDPEADESLLFTGTAPFDDPLIGGLIAQAPELAARGTPTGQGNMDWGFHAGGGVEVRLSRALSLNLDYRFAGIGGGEHRLHVVGGSLGVHW